MRRATGSVRVANVLCFKTMWATLLDARRHGIASARAIRTDMDRQSHHLHHVEVGPVLGAERAVVELVLTDPAFQLGLMCSGFGGWHVCTAS
jgi:hypothetical protein